ncbi:MAG: CopG family ribbon-helix-helix protein, partial [Candidatus Bathyarchaeia archaeon]
SIEDRGFANRSEIVRQALRTFMAEDKNLRETEGEIISTITIIYERKAKREQIYDIQHSYGDVISTYLHAHIDDGHCLEVIVVKGQASIIKKLVDAFKTNEQIIQLKVTVLGRSEF